MDDKAIEYVNYPSYQVGYKDGMKAVVEFVEWQGACRTSDGNIVDIYLDGELWQTQLKEWGYRG